MISDIGVEVSSSKTFISPVMLEFAKRIFYKGEEVTPFPISSVVDVEGAIALLIAAMFGETRKGLNPKSGIPCAVASFSRLVLRLRKKVWNLRGQKAQRCLSASLFLSGKASAVETLISICGLDASLGEHWSEKSARALILRGLADRFVEGVQGTAGKELFLAANRCLSEPNCGHKVWPNLQESLPIFNVVRQVEERLLRVEEDVVHL